MKIRFRIGILSSVLLLLLASTTSIWVAGDWAAVRTARSLADTLTTQAGLIVANRLERDLEPSCFAARSVTLLLEQGVVSAARPDELLDLLEKKAESLKLDRIYVGKSDGSFFMVVRGIDGRMRRQIVDPAKQVQLWSFTSADGREVQEVEPISYDPRSRDWYSLAVTNGAAWTPVYRFASDKQLGMTRVQLVDTTTIGGGVSVVGVDVTLAELSGFLAALEVTPKARMFILDRSMNLIAHSDPSTVLGNGDAIASASEAPDPTIRAAAARLSLQDGDGLQTVALLLAKGEDLRFETAGKSRVDSWQVLLRPSATTTTLPPFLVGIAIPGADLFETLSISRSISATIAIVSILLGAILALVFSRGVSRPITHLELAMRRVGAFDLDVAPDFKTVYLEVQSMLNAFEKMLTGLRGFAKYVPRDVVRDLVASGRQPELEAEEREISVYFSDIGGFTTLCERMDAQPLVAQLGEYLEVVVRAIKAQGGTIDKFIGDAVMALWNAPRFNPHHPLGAASGAVDVLAAVEEINVRFVERGLPPFPTRIGIATARVVVGNIGSSQRLSFTALGDGVNLAARLEGANKHYGTKILASGSLVSRLPSGVLVTQPIDVLRVRGKERGVTVYEILGRRGKVDPPRVEAAEIYSQAFAAYLRQDFAEAIKRFGEVLLCTPGYLPAELLLERSRLLDSSPPDGPWDGSFSFDQK